MFSMNGVCLDQVVLLKLSHRKGFVPIILALVGEQANILLELLVDALGLAIGLQVIGRRSCELDPEDVIQFASEVGNKLRSMIQHDSVRESMELPDIL